MCQRRWKRAALSTAIAVALAGCASVISPDDDEAGGVATSFRLTVVVTNVGDGFGRVFVEFPEGAVERPCDDVLGPAGRCDPSVVLPDPPTEVEVRVAAEPGSRFAGWTGLHCEGVSTECTIVNDSRETDAVVEVEPRFVLEASQ